jgi:tripartite-type tricarboxylate transporter receptor subunit TctC
MLVPIALALACAAHGSAHGRSYPAKPVRVVITGGPVSATDIRIRWVAPKLTAALGQPIVLDNRPGAGGTIASEMYRYAEDRQYTPPAVFLNDYLRMLDAVGFSRGVLVQSGVHGVMG